MEFWGIEVKSGQPFDVKLGEGKVLHLSQACLGETKKETKDAACLFITVEDKKLVLGTLHSERLPQQLFDLVFDKDFQISHNWKNGSVYFYGYKADQPTDENEDSEEFSSDDEEMEAPLPVANGKPEAKEEEKAVVGGAKKDVNAKGGKQKVKIVEPPKDEKDSDDDDDESDDSDAMLEDSDDSEDNDDSSDDDDEDDSDEDEETPKKEQQSGKKRPNESASKTPVTDKKAKVANTPQKTEGKKGGAVHIATPHPSKQAVAKTPAGGSKSNQKSPASEGAHSCKSCNRNFKTEGALSSHNQAKHSASK